MPIYSRKKSNTAILILNGSIQDSDIPEIESIFLGYLQEGVYNFILNLSQAHVISSQAMTLLAHFNDQVRSQGGRLFLCELPQAIYIILQAANLHIAFSIVTTEQDAWESMQETKHVERTDSENITLEHRGADLSIVRIKGDIDTHLAVYLKEAIYKLLERRKPHILVDLSSVSYIDSTGLGVFLPILKRLTKVQKTLSLFGGEDSVKEIFQMTQLDKLIPHYQTEEEALRMYRFGSAR